MTEPTFPRRLTGALLLTFLTAMLTAAALVVPSGLSLNPADPAAALAAVREQTGLHLAELAVDVLGWLALTAAGLLMAATAPTASGRQPAVLGGGLLAAAGLAGLLHDAGNLALTQLAADAADPATIAVARAVLATAKWSVNLAGLLWAAATAALAAVQASRGLRRAGALATACGLAAVTLPWTAGAAGPSVALEQLGYALQLPVMVWYAALARRCLAW